MMPGRDIIVIGASAGGVETLSQLVRHLPPALPAAIFVVLHVPAHSPSLMPQILSRKGPLTALHPDDGEVIHAGRIYIAPPDQHLLLDIGRMRLTRGPRENGHRPAVDPLFRTAARSYGQRVIGVVLSGTLDDGTAGLEAIKQRGGVAIVQDPEEALYPGMPRSAQEAVAIDYSLPVAAIAELLDRLTREPVDYPEGNSMSNGMEFESQMAAFNMDAIEDENRPGLPSVFACPDCGGTLWEIDDGEVTRFRCRVGHAWTANGLLAQQSEGVETALWTALRALEERAVLCNRIADRMRKRGMEISAARFEGQAAVSRHRATILRQVLVSEPTTNDEPGPEAEGTEEGSGHPPRKEGAPDG
jgi:two-component system, chemotaxis family, protein-glutamate methylesterase/glutaminase